MQASYQEGKRWSKMPSLFLSQNDSQKTQKCFIWDFNSYNTFLRRKRFIPNAPPCASAFRTYAIRCWLRLNKLLSPASSRTRQLWLSIPIHRDESRFGLHRCLDVPWRISTVDVSNPWRIRRSICNTSNTSDRPFIIVILWFQLPAGSWIITIITR